jgi:hypothetical protein
LKLCLRRHYQQRQHVQQTLAAAAERFVDVRSVEVAGAALLASGESLSR